MRADQLVPFEAPGLSADWLNAWLAAIGVTVLLPDVKLSWTNDVVPYAVFWVSHGQDLTQAVFEALPSSEEFDERVPHLARNPSVESYRETAKRQRAARANFLAMRLTDLTGNIAKGEDLGSGQMDVPAPGGRTLFDGARDALHAIQSVEEIRDSLRGLHRRVKGNGLGFDARRGTAGVASNPKSIVPVVEYLAFVAMALFPVGVRQGRVMQRNWDGSQFDRHAFRWFSWKHPLDRWAIDAVLDSPNSIAQAWWALVPFKPSEAKDTTRFMFAEPVDG